MDGGTETTASLLQTFILAMINFPAVQKRAQEEIDRVIGGQRVPDLDDFDKLPYLKAVIKEVLIHLVLSRLTNEESFDSR